MLLSQDFRSDESDDASENNVVKKYSTLQNNHRRLLGVTTALTEALEYTVRGDEFNLEDTLNVCMKIYPELFTFQHKKPQTYYYSRNKIYNTSVSEDDHSGISMVEKLILNSTDPEEQIEDKLMKKLERKLTENNQNDLKKSVPFHELEQKNSESQNIQTSRASGIPKMKKKFNGEKLSINILEDFTNLSQIGDTSPFLILTPDAKRNSFSSQPDKNNIQFLHSPFGSMSTNQELINESCYVVNHPESDNETIHRKYIELHEKEFANKESDAVKKEKYYPYEIIVQSGKSDKNQDNNGNVWIKIKPDAAQENERVNVNSNAQTQTIISQPLETCIIITKHVDSGVQTSKPKGQDSDKKHSESLRFIEEESNPKNVTMDKLQKLSTGLKLKTNEMKSTQIEEVPVNENKNQVNPVIDPRYFINELCENPKLDTRNVHGSTKNYYKNLKIDLRNKSAHECASILQSLRLTLIHSLAKERADLVMSHIENDILDINNATTLLENILPDEIVNGWDLILQQMILKFLNTLSSIWKGRDYLTSNTRTMSCLQNHFYEKTNTKSTPDTISQDMLIAIFHKLCTRENQHGILVNSGVVEKIFYNVWERHESMNLYRLRHSLGLLINLSVYSSGRSLLEPTSSEMLTVLTTLLKKNDKKIIPYIARLIYVLMASEKFHKKAKETDLITTLEKTINVTNKRLKLQLDVLKSVINQESPHEYLIGTEESFLLNIEAEMDELEEEVEIGEPSLTSNTDESIPIRSKISTNAKTEKSNLAKKSFNETNTASSVQIPKRVIPKQSADTKAQKRIPRTNSVIPKRRIKSNEIQNRSSAPFIRNEIKSSNLRPRNQARQQLNKHEIDEDNDAGLDEDRIIPIFTAINNKKPSDEDPKHTSFVVLSDSNKTVSLDLNVSSTSESINSLEQIQLPDDIKRADELTEKLDKDAKLSSVFIQHEKITAIEYDYCEDTKEIQSPIQCDNIFKDNRQSPYQGLIIDGQKQMMNALKQKSDVDILEDAFNKITSNESSLTEPKN